MDEREAHRGRSLTRVSGLLAAASGLFQRLPRFRGKQRLLTALCELLSSEHRDVSVYSRALKHEVLLPSLKEPQSLGVLTNGLYEPDTVEAILRGLPESPVIVDVGANIGLITLGAAAGLDGRGTIVAVEGSPVIFPYLQRNVTRSKRKVTLVQSLLYDEVTSVPFYSAPSEKFGMGSIAPQFNSAPLQLRTKTLSGVLEELGIDRVDVIKIDVEGAELNVLRGAEKLISGPRPPRIIFEYYAWAETRLHKDASSSARTYLESMGYRIWNLADYLAGASFLPPNVPAMEGMLVAEK